MTKNESRKLQEVWAEVCKAVDQISPSRLLDIGEHIPRLLMPNALRPFDPDPSGTHCFSDQRRLDTAFQEYLSITQAKIKQFMEVVE